MATWRKLHVKTVESQDVQDMPDDLTRLIWVLLPLALDKEGRGIDLGSWVHAKIMPLRDDVSHLMIADAMDWFANRKMIVRYEITGRCYFYIPTWHSYQKTDREAESIYPPPCASKARVTHEQGASESSLDEDEDIDKDKEEDKKEATPPSYSFDAAAEKVFTDVTGMTAIPGKEKDDALYKLRALKTKHKDKAVEIVKPYYVEWLERKYSKTNLAWLDWAIAEQIPPKNKNKQAEPFDPASMATEVY